MDERYFDAKFDGLKDLMISQQLNLNSHIIAVSNNVKEVREDLAEHKESSEAHGRKAADGAISAAVAWLGFAIAAIIGIFEVSKGDK